MKLYHFFKKAHQYIKYQLIILKEKAVIQDDLENFHSTWNFVLQKLDTL